VEIDMRRTAGILNAFDSENHKLAASVTRVLGES
jgi:hypothetical protein